MANEDESARRAHDPRKWGSCCSFQVQGQPSELRDPSCWLQVIRKLLMTHRPAMGPRHGAFQHALLQWWSSRPVATPYMPPGLPVMKASSVGLEDALPCPSPLI